MGWCGGSPIKKSEVMNHMFTFSFIQALLDCSCIWYWPQPRKMWFMQCDTWHQFMCQV